MYIYIYIHENADVYCVRVATLTYEVYCVPTLASYPHSRPEFRRLRPPPEVSAEPPWM